MFFKGRRVTKRKFQGEGISPTNLCRYKKTRVITLSCGIKISPLCFFFSFRYIACVWRTERQTELRSQYRASIAASRGKNCCNIAFILADENKLSWGNTCNYTRIHQSNCGFMCNKINAALILFYYTWNHNFRAAAIQHLTQKNN